PLVARILGPRAEAPTSIILSHTLSEIAASAASTTLIRHGSAIETIDMQVPQERKHTLIPRIIKGMVGRDMDSLYPERSAEIGEEIFRIEDWHVGHPTQPGRTVVDGASLNVRAGEV